MLANDKMKANRYLDWMIARRKFAQIQDTLLAGGSVVVSTYGKAWQFNKPGHVDCFKVRRDGLYMARGKSWDCMNYSAIRHYR